MFHRANVSLNNLQGDIGLIVGSLIIPGIKCLDKSASCPMWARHGRCVTDTWVKKNCLNSCNKTGSCDKEQIKPEGQ